MNITYNSLKILRKQANNEDPSCANTHEDALLHGLTIEINFGIPIAGIIIVNGYKLCGCVLTEENECYLDFSASCTIPKS
jgi:hypothetical protein